MTTHEAEQWLEWLDDGNTACLTVRQGHLCLTVQFSGECCWHKWEFPRHALREVLQQLGREAVNPYSSMTWFSAALISMWLRDTCKQLGVEV